MKILVYTDFTCPFCYIIMQNLNGAIEEADIQVDFEYHSFQTYSIAPTITNDSIYDVAMKNGMTMVQARAKAKYIEDYAKQSNLNLAMDKVIMANTFNTHMILQYMKEQGKSELYVKAMMEAIFVNGVNIGNIEQLESIAGDVEPNLQSLEPILNCDKYKNLVIDEINQSHRNGITSVPTYIINNKVVTGAQEKSLFAQLLNENK